MSERPIGIFDSGVGGLVVAKEIMGLLPNENLVYFADSLHNPYGPKSREEIKGYVEEISHYLAMKRQCKGLVIACNTATVAGLEATKDLFIPVVGSIDASIKLALEKTRNGRLGVLATDKTIESGIYQEKIKEVRPTYQVFGVGAPALVTAVEEGDFFSARVKELAQGYLEELKEASIDTLIIGCTHFMYLEKILQEILTSEVLLISAGKQIAQDIKGLLQKEGLLNNQERKGQYEFLSSDVQALSPRFLSEGPRFLGWEKLEFQQCNIFQQQQKTIVLGVIGSDVHAVGNKILHYAFEEAGFKVINIGVMASQREFIEAAIETDADAILVSSLYGHGEMDCQGFREKCIEAGLGDILLYVGGNLVVGKQDWQGVEKKFLDMGFNRVYPPGTMVEEAIQQLNADLEELAKGKEKNGNCHTI